MGKVIILSILILPIVFAAENETLERESLPIGKDAISLWLITRTGWVYCDRASEYMKKIKQDFDAGKCKGCYETLFNHRREKPESVENDRILGCVENFGVSRTFVPTFGFPPSPVELLHQNPFESIAVQPFTCNSALNSRSRNSNNNRPSLRQFQLPMPSLRHVTQLLSVQGFSYKNDPKVEYPRREYVNCLLGALFETELALCPMNADRRRCAAQHKVADEDLILSKNVPISYSNSS